VVVAALVVQQRPLAGCVVHVVGADLLAAGGRHGGLQDVERVAGVAAGCGHDLVADLVGQRGRQLRLAAADDAARSSRSRLQPNSWHRDSNAELTSK
jgi:hypothetical protein